MKIEEVRGLGPKKAEALARRGISTLEDLVRTYPADYEDRRFVLPMGQLRVGQAALVKGRVLGVKDNNFHRKRTRVLRVTLQDAGEGAGSGAMEAVFFNCYGLAKAFRIGEEYYLYGKPGLGMGRIQMIHPEFVRAAEGTAMGLIPVYPHMRGVSRRDMQKFLAQILDNDAFQKEVAAEYLPAWYLEKHDLPSLGEALEKVHRPREFYDIRRAKRRFLYEDMLLLHLGLLLMRGPEREGTAFPAGDPQEYIDALPFPLTEGQRQAVEEVLADMRSRRPMNRLLQGDVGSGKTVVAEIALYTAVKNGCQGAFMMPTEVLARQQYEGLSRRFEAFGIRVGLLIGSLSAAEKNACLQGLAEGEIDIVVGTHALIQKGVRFAKLGLVITDEQHRFGVQQRSAIKEKGTEPDCLVMSATPIPRTLAMILFGDMSISTIRELPAERRPIQTKTVTGKTRKRIYDFVGEEIARGRQAYVVCPLIEDSESMEQLRSALTVHEELARRFGPEHVGLLHGDMSSEEKREVMQAFEEGRIKLLVSTVVIEVGINVPNATVMVIENSERFGLAQLHQLRGRVGRGGEQSYCILITEDLSEVSLERARIITESSDGFHIAEKDLELRGPGELFGEQQHGIPSSYLFNLINNSSVYREVEPDAKEILAAHPGLKDPEAAGLRHQLQRIFGRDIRTTL